MSASKKCCDCDCNQGRNCPNRNEESIPDAVIAVSVGVVLMFAILATITW